MATENIQDLQNQENEESFDTKGLLLAFLANWKWFVICGVVAVVAAVFYIISVIPTYRIDASIYLRDQSDGPGNAFSMNAADPMVAFKNYIDETELEVLKSRNNIIKIVDSLNLCYTYYGKGTFRDKPQYRNNPVSASMSAEDLSELESTIAITVTPPDAAGKCDVVAKTKVKNDEGKMEEVEKKFTGVTLPVDLELAYGNVRLERNAAEPKFESSEIIFIDNPRDMARSISDRLNIEFAKKSDRIIRVSLLDQVFSRGEDIVQVMLAFYNKNIIADKNQSAMQTEAFILERLVMINDELRDVENRLQKYRQTHSISDLKAQSSLNLQQRSEYESTLAKIMAELAMYDEIENIMKNSGEYTALPTIVTQPSLTSIIETYNTKVHRFKRTIDGSTPDNPLVVSMQEELNNDRSRILQTLSSARASLVAERDNIQRLQRARAGELASLPPVDKGYQEIFREKEVKVNIYTFLLQRREEIALQKTLATNTARLIDDPLAEAPVSPRKMLILAAALMFGLGLPAGIIFLKRSLFPSFSTQEDLEHLTKVPVLGEICSRSKESKGEIVVGENVTTPEAELFRLMRNNISFTRAGAESRVIMVTSAVSGEGKTFITANLAMTYALMKKRVVVLGMDLRRPKLASSFGLTNRIGVTTFLSGQEKDIDKLLYQSKVNPNLYIMPAGPIPPNPNELLMSDNMTQLIETLRAEFDYVLIDSAPIGLVSDSYLITHHTDLQIFVSRANRSTPGGLKLLHDAIRAGKLSAPYIVLNDVNITSGAYSYQRYGKYGYSSNHTYGYGYGNKRKQDEHNDK